MRKSERREDKELLDAIQAHIVNKLRNGLDPSLTYHTVEHTLDVTRQALRIGIAEKIESRDLLLLQVAALYHDTGFLSCYRGHEEVSCLFAQNELPEFGFDADEIEKMCGMIMATKIPQSPKNKLEEIICDADVDYLGRPDFFATGEKLYREFLDQGIVVDFDDWNRLQVRFLEAHHYFTQTSITLRTQEKLRFLEEVRKQVG